MPEAPYGAQGTDQTFQFKKILSGLFSAFIFGSHVRGRCGHMSKGGVVTCLREVWCFVFLQIVQRRILREDRLAVATAQIVILQKAFSEQKV